MTKDEITRPEPGSLPPRISFIEQMDDSAGYYVRFKDKAGEPERKYIPILQHESQEAALRAAIEYRDRRAEELGLPVESQRGPHTEEVREEMSDSHNRLGLRGLGLSLDRSDGRVYPRLVAMWTGEDGQRQVRRGMASRGIWSTVELLVPLLQEHIHSDTPKEELARRGAEGAARRLLQVAWDPEREEEVRRRIESLLDRWAQQSERDRDTIDSLR